MFEDEEDEIKFDKSTNSYQILLLIKNENKAAREGF